MTEERDVTPPTIESITDRIAQSIGDALAVISNERGKSVHFSLTLFEADGIPCMVSDTGGTELMMALRDVLQEIVNQVQQARGRDGPMPPIVVQ